MDLAPSPRGDEGLSPSASGVSPSSARQKSLVDRLEQMMVFKIVLKVVVIHVMDKALVIQTMMEQ